MARGCLAGHPKHVLLGSLHNSMGVSVATLPDMLAVSARRMPSLHCKPLLCNVPLQNEIVVTMPNTLHTSAESLRLAVLLFSIKGRRHVAAVCAVLCKR